MKLFSEANLLIYRADYGLIEEVIQDVQQQQPDFYNFETLAWRLSDKPAPLHFTAKQHAHQTQLQTVDANGKRQAVTLPFTDEAAIENAIHCWVLLKHLKIPLRTIRQEMKKLQRLAMRLELKAGSNDCSIINDAYSADIHSLSIALNFLNQQRQHPKHTVILSDILESGQPRDRLYQSVARLLRQHGVERLIGIGNRISRSAHLFSDLETTFFTSTQDFLPANPCLTTKPFW